MLKVISLKMLANKRYKTLAFTGEFSDSFGQPERGSIWLVAGNSGEGKTEFCMQLLSYIKQFGKAAYYSKEQGSSSSIQQSVKRNGLGHVRRKECDFAFGGMFDDLVNYLKTKRNIKTIIIDSIDYLMLTIEQIRYLIETFKGITMIFIAWAKGSKPKSAAAQALEYMADVKVFVKMYVAFPRSRYGGNLPYVIWKERAKQYHPFLNI